MHKEKRHKAASSSPLLLPRSLRSLSALGASVKQAAVCAFQISKVYLTPAAPVALPAVGVPDALAAAEHVERPELRPAAGAGPAQAKAPCHRVCLLGSTVSITRCQAQYSAERR